jgi:DNA polymerase
MTTTQRKREEKLKSISRQISSCTNCQLCKTRKNTVPGEGPANAKLFFIGEAPGKTEDETGKPFCGQSGRLLTEMLENAGIDRRDIFITSILKCRPPNNRKPQKEEVEACTPHLLEQLDAIKPKVTVLLGLVAIKNTIGDHKKMKEMHGKILKNDGKSYFIAYHPAAARRFPWIRKVMEKDFKILKNLQGSR